MKTLTLDTVKDGLIQALKTAPLTGCDEAPDGSVRKDERGYCGAYHRTNGGNATYVTSDGAAIVLGGDIDEFYRPVLDLDALAQTLFNSLTEA